MTVYPAALRDTFWDNIATGMMETRYLGSNTLETQGHA